MEEMDVESCTKELAELAQKSKREQRELEERARAEQERHEVEERQQKEVDEVQIVQDNAPDPVDQLSASTEQDPTILHASPADSATDPPEVVAVPTTDVHVEDPPISYSDVAASGSSHSPSLLSTSKLSAEAPAFSPSGFAAPAPAAKAQEESTLAEEEQQPGESAILSRSWAEVVAKGEGKAEEVGAEVRLCSFERTSKICSCLP